MSVARARYPLTFELDTDMLKLLHDEFNPGTVADRLATAIRDKRGRELEEIGSQVLLQYGQEWMDRTLELGERYSDRTYEVVKAVIQRTKEMYFPLVPQRFIEIAYLATQGFLKLPIVEDSRQRLAYKLVDCDVFQAVNERSGSEVANKLLCKHACLSALNRLCQKLNLDVSVAMEAERTRDRFCQFALTQRSR